MIYLFILIYLPNHHPLVTAHSRNRGTISEPQVKPHRIEKTRKSRVKSLWKRSPWYLIEKGIVEMGGKVVWYRACKNRWLWQWTVAGKWKLEGGRRSLSHISPTVRDMGWCYKCGYGGVPWRSASMLDIWRGWGFVILDLLHVVIFIRWMNFLESSGIGMVSSPACPVSILVQQYISLFKWPSRSFDWPFIELECEWSNFISSFALYYTSGEATHHHNPSSPILLHKSLRTPLNVSKPF